MFFHYNQNNTGGTFKEDSSVCTDVIIEADNYEEANMRALEIGIYFGGCIVGIDCPCCGDRWYPMDSNDDGNEVASIYSTPINEVTKTIFRYKCYIYYKDGSKEVINFRENKEAVVSR